MTRTEDGKCELLTSENGSNDYTSHLGVGTDYKVATDRMSKPQWIHHNLLGACLLLIVALNRSGPTTLGCTTAAASRIGFANRVGDDRDER